MAKKKDALKKERIKTVIEVRTYMKKKESTKKFTVNHNNKDGSHTRYGVTRQGHRYKVQVISVKSESEIKKIFDKAKEEKDLRKNSITIVMKQYTGSMRKSTGKVSNGRVTGVNFFNVDKKAVRKSGNKITTYTTSHSQIINTIKIVQEEYKIEMKFGINSKTKKGKKKNGTKDNSKNKSKLLYSNRKQDKRKAGKNRKV